MEIKCAHNDVVDIVNLQGHPKNSNSHPDKQINLLAKIMKYQGWRNPIVVSKRSGFIVAGHGRLEAAKINGWERAPVDYQEFANEADEIAHLNADNKIAELAQFDIGVMVDAIKELDLPDDYDLDLFGIPDLVLNLPLEDIDEKAENNEPDKLKHVLEVKFTEESEMIEVYEELLGRGLIVRCL